MLRIVGHEGVEECLFMRHLVPQSKRPTSLRARIVTSMADSPDINRLPCALVQLAHKVVVKVDDPRIAWTSRVTFDMTRPCCNHTRFAVSPPSHSTSSRSS
jgi:hypothetical protein